MDIRCGIDVIRIDRVRRAVERLGQPFLDRVWTAGEQSYCRTARQPLSDASCASLAARFAAKEAIAKALGSGIGRDGIRWTDLAICSDPSGQPQAQLSGPARTRFLSLGGTKICLSLTHDGNLAIAQCVLLCENAS